jgi:SAM-dependent methyltransferase
VLEVGPFAPITQLLRTHAEAVTTLDLYNPTADVRANLEQLPQEDASFDSVMCMHVLEHVDDDAAALRELRRILRSGGRALIQVPIRAGVPTYEDPSVVDPKERLAVFGQHDHVRTYGDDFADRMKAAGFTTERIELADVAPPRVIRRLSLDDGDNHFFLARA